MHVIDVKKDRVSGKTCVTVGWHELCWKGWWPRWVTFTGELVGHSTIWHWVSNGKRGGTMTELLCHEAEWLWKRAQMEEAAA